MRRIKKKISRLSIRTALTIFLLPFFVLLMFGFCALFFVGLHHYSRLIKANMCTSVELSRDGVNREIQNVQETAETVFSRIEFYRMNSNIKMGRDPITPEEYLAVSTSINEFVRYNAIYVAYGGMYLSDNSIVYGSFNNRNADIDLLRKIDYSRNLGRTTLEWMRLDELLPEKYAKENTGEFVVLKTFGDKESKVRGFGMFGIRKEAMLNQIKSNHLTPRSSMTFIDADGTILETDWETSAPILKELQETDFKVIQKKIAETSEAESISFEVGDFYVIYSPIAIRDTGILAVVPTEELYMSSQNFTYLFLCLGVAVLLIFVILYFVLPEYFSRPIVKLLGQMHRVNGLEDTGIIDAEGYQELNQIRDGINDMMDRISVLTASIQKEMTAKQATQLQYLFAQINPHFLYNTLDCIRELCVCQENEKAEKMIERLVVFYKIGVSKGKTFITIEEELRHVMSYLSILQMRFEDFQFRIEASDNVQKYYTLGMILQPIVENAVYHGIRPYKTDGTIVVSVKKKADLIEFHVKDDGGGIEEDILEKINKSLDEPICEYTEKSYGVYGIKNVQDRIQLAYGKQYKIKIDTELDYGTEITVTIPCEERYNDKDCICG